ncbi:MAG TPA: peptide deformylase [Patescibacteria group bacterium]|jgi:peptide deformylase|nr:peptide deformylase [Patescibacteria group bacterium]
MTRDTIITLPNPHLRHKSRPIKIIDQTVLQLIDDMQSATLDWEDHRQHEFGVALAAVQIDRLYRIVIIRNNFEDKDDRSFITLINPKVIKAEGKPVFDQEGCLSVKDLYGLVPRYPKVRVSAIGSDGNELRIRAEGFLARVLQHEIDHTNGILFIDHIKQQDAFFHLTKKGELIKVNHEKILQSSILW